MKKLVFISQPMKDKTPEEITIEREKAINVLIETHGKDIEIIDSYFTEYPEKLKENKIKNVPLFYLSKSLELLSTADIAVFIGNWKQYRGCRIEHTCAAEYGLEILEV